MTTIQEIQELVKANTIGMRELRASQAETARVIQASQAETSKEIRELRALQAETGRQIQAMSVKLADNWLRIRALQAETSRQIQAVNVTLSGMGLSNGEMAEEFFYRGLRKTMCLGDLHFDEIKRNVYGKRMKTEVDIFLFNTNASCIIEVKYRVRPTEVSGLINQKVNFIRELYPQFTQIYFGIATMSTNDQIIQVAQEEGIFLLTQGGDDMQVICDKVKTF